MMRFHPRVRALCDLVRRPAILQILAGLLLITPAGVMSLRGIDTVEPIAMPATLPPVEVVAEPTTVGQAALFAREFEISTSLAKRIVDAANEAGVNPRTAVGLVRAESSFRTSAISPVGAIGLTQLMPATARWLEPGITRQQLKNPETNLRIGFKYLRDLIEKYNGNEKLALTAFNRGPGTVDRLLKRGRNPDNGYAEKVLTGKSKRHVSLMNAKFGRRS
ncbi:MAG: lytic transglycosylase domain-containing protein [Gemmatimonadota bacterium]